MCSKRSVYNKQLKKEIVFDFFIFFRIFAPSGVISIKEDNFDTV